ncbi:MAG: hypothetical protein WDW38_005166 [Sanguina aurantia]
MLLLVGPPGSGKSTLSASLVQRSSLSWAVVNQDTIKGGSPGTRKQCLSAARRALSSGDCCVIDRCNFDPDQRGDFLQLAASMHVPVHAVLLNLPVEVCVQRAVGRINHPSKVHGPMAVGIVRNVFNQIRAAGAPAAALQQGSFVFAKMPWTEALRSIVRRPEAFRNEHPELFIDGECIMFDDKYPKARFHQLVIPRDQSLESIYDLQARHVPLLQHMMAVAQAQSPQQHGGCSMGFHAVPSMRQLHMHVISQDYDSPALKHAKHWNSFTTAYFLPVDQVISTLQLQGSIPMDIATYEKAAKGAMKCPHCHCSLRNMPAVKTHTAGAGCRKSAPGVAGVADAGSGQHHLRF